MITIVPYEDSYQQAFRELNLEWLDKYNLTESHDLMILDDPRAAIINTGGHIWLAMDGAEVVGTAAIINEHDGLYELAKMSVKPSFQGKGISKLLIEACLAKAKEIGAKKLLLFSNSQLQTALKLYEKYGFKTCSC